MNCAALILNYNGRQHLETCLPSAIEASRRCSVRTTVVVVDNCSTEPDAAFVRRMFPQVEVMAARSNDYLFSLNEVVASRTEEVVVLLNNDLRIAPDCFEVLVRALREDTRLFAASATVRDWDGTRVQFARSFLRRRRAWYSIVREKFSGETGSTLYAAGGAAAYRRSVFLALGGFDRLFHPAFYEEVDVSYRAWRNGWRVEYCPTAMIEHRLGGTLRSQRRADEWRRVITRNQALFNLKDCGDGLSRLALLATFPLRVARAQLGADAATRLGMRDALIRAPQALASRLRRRADFQLGEAEAFGSEVLRIGA